MSDELEPPLTDEAICRMGTAVAPLPATLPRLEDHAGNPAKWMFGRLGQASVQMNLDSV
jgi:hypothetical protein